MQPVKQTIFGGEKNDNWSVAHLKNNKYKEKGKRYESEDNVLQNKNYIF